MHCTNCGAAIPSGARYCPACGKLSGSSQARARPTGGETLKSVAGLAAVIAMIMLGSRCIGGGSSLSGPPAKAVEAAIDPKAAEIRAKGCDDGLAALAKAGVLKARPAADRMEVEDDLWAELPAKQKLTFAAALRCSSLAGYDAGNTTAIATVEGYRSGKLLVTAGPGGPILN